MYVSEAMVINNYTFCKLCASSVQHFNVFFFYGKIVTPMYYPVYRGLLVHLSWELLFNLHLVLKGHSGADWPIFFSRSIKSLIYNISPTKFGLSIFTVRGQKFEVSFWRWEIPNSAGRSYRRHMLVVQRALIRIIIRWGSFFVFQRILNGTAMCYNI